MSEKPKQAYRKRHLFARSLSDVVASATKPMMDKRGKLYSALLSNWPAIVGPELATLTRPGRLHFPNSDAASATLHLDVHPAKAPEMPYHQQQILDQCARYFGYRAIDRIVLHPAPELAKRSTNTEPASKTAPTEPPPADMRELLQRLRGRIMSSTPNNNPSKE